jgi:hypothetical protein
VPGFLCPFSNNPFMPVCRGLFSMDDQHLHRRESDARIDRIERSLERIAERLEKVAVLIAQEQEHERRLARLEHLVEDLGKKDAVQTKQLSLGERVLWALLTAAVGTAGMVGQGVFFSPDLSQQQAQD